MTKPKPKRVEAWAVVGEYDFAVVKRRNEVPRVYENNPRVRIERLVESSELRSPKAEVLRLRKLERAAAKWVNRASLVNTYDLEVAVRALSKKGGSR